MIPSNLLIYRKYLYTTSFDYLLLFLALLSLFSYTLILHKKAYAMEAFYSIRLDTVHGMNNADKRVEDLKKLGHNAFYKSKDKEVRKGEFGIYIERYETRDEAEKEAKVLNDLGLIEKYTIEALEEQNGAVLQAPNPSELDQKGFFFQVGSMKERIHAEQMVENLQKAGYHALFSHETIKNKGTWYRIYIEGYGSRAEAEKDAKKLVKSGMISGYTLRQRGEKTGIASFKNQQYNGNVFFIHVSSFREKDNALRYVATLEQHGLKAFMVKESISGKIWFRVYIGDYENENSARRTGAELVRKGIITYFKPVKINLKKLQK